MNDNETMTGTVADLAQTALTALEAAEMLADPVECRALLATARAMVLEMAAAVGRYVAGRPETGTESE
jgi:hypothetical protein